MLKNNIFNRMKGFKEKDKLNLKLHGRVQTWAIKNGEVIYYDDGSNTVTHWAKHANIQLITGEHYTTHGNHYTTDGGDVIPSIRSKESIDHSDSYNSDGTILSKKQYLSDNSDYYDDTDNWFYYKTKPDFELDDSDDSDNYNDGLFLPLFPTKMIFGTGVEYSSWAEVPEEFKKDMGDPLWDVSLKNPSNGGWTEETFNESIDLDGNYYSNKISNGVMSKSRTINSLLSSANINAVDESEKAISGAIKTTYNGNNGEVLELTDQMSFEKKSTRGTGMPCFIYFDRTLRNFENSEVKTLTGDSGEMENIENSVSFSVTMPAQQQGQFYPYNNFLLKEVGLFSDGLLTINNEIPVSGESSNISKSMPCGIMWAKRKITPVFKRHEIEIISKWTLYYA